MVIVPVNVIPPLSIDEIVENVKNKNIPLKEVLKRQLTQYSAVATVLISDPECSPKVLRIIAKEHTRMDARIAETIIHHPKTNLEIIRTVIMRTKHEVLLNRLTTHTQTSTEVLDILVDRDIQFVNSMVSTHQNVTLPILEKILCSPQMTPAERKVVFHKLNKMPKYLGWPDEWIAELNPVKKS